MANSDTAKTKASRADFVSSAMRSALLEIAWSHIALEAPVKALAATGATSASYSTKNQQALIVVGCSLRPKWPAIPHAHTQESLELEYGLNFEFTLGREAEFICQQTLRQYAHCLYSDGDMPEITKMAKDLGANPALFSLLETIRVDCLVGIALSRRMSWSAFYPSSEIVDLPPWQQPLASWLRSGEFSTSGKGDAFDKICSRFYGRLIAAGSSRDVAILAIEWERVIAPQLGLLPKENNEAEQASPPDSDAGDASDGAASENKGGDQPGSAGEHSQAEGASGSAEGSLPDIDADAGSQAAPDGAAGESSSGLTPSQEAEAGQPSSGEQEDPAKPEPGMLEHIAEGQEQKAFEQAREAFANEGSKAIRPVDPPTSDEVNEHKEAEKASHGFSEKQASDAQEADNGPWSGHPCNPNLLAGSIDFFDQQFFRDNSPIDQEQALAARRILERMLTGQTRTTFSQSPSKRLSIRHLVQGEAKYARREDFSRGAMHIDLIVDCSASMSGKPVESAKALVSALSELSSKGMIHGRAIFSSGEGWMACPLPMKPELIRKMDSFSGSEGIRAALDENVRQLREADAVFVFTDARITDQPFAKNHLSQRKVEPMGLYVGEASAEEHMAKYFERYLIRPNLEELCLAMVQRFLSQKKMVSTQQQAKAKLRR